MKHTIDLNTAVLFERTAEGPLSEHEISSYAEAPASAGLSAQLPAQAADVLLAHGKIEDPRQLNGARDCLWIAERDWVYRIEFPQPEDSDAVRLVCKGLDTVADLYLNGELIAQNRDMYLALEKCLSLKAENVLIIHFHSPHRYIAGLNLPEDWKGKVHPNRMLRKPHEDFNSFNGAFPYFTPVGIYDKVLLEVIDTARLADVDISADVDVDGHLGKVGVSVRGVPAAETAQADLELRVRLLDPTGAVVAEQITCPYREVTCPQADAASGAVLAAQLEVSEPELWWPLGYGDQPLYTVEMELLAGGRVVDRAEREIGFRHLQMNADFNLRVNGRQVKLFGANFAPMEQFTHVWPAERVNRMMDLVENANCTTLRIWGPGAPYGDDFYTACDRRGILIWSELYHTWGMFPEGEAFYELCRREAIQHVRSLKHHASIFMWCGANEVHMGSELMQPGQRLISQELYHKIYPAVCKELDPGRYYHIDSPHGGSFANDPDFGDSHGYTHFWFVRGADYPVILTENARWSPPLRKTLERYIGDRDAFWPEGFESRIRHTRLPQVGPGSLTAGLNNDGKVGQRDFSNDKLLPPSWKKLGKDGGITNRRAGPIGDFYDTGDTPDGLIYRIGSAHGTFVRREIEKFRRGRPASEAHLPRRVQGHYWWRFNGTWPLIETELVDYLLEPKIAYYHFRRAQAPLLLSFEFDNRGWLWGTNDSGQPFNGTVCLEFLPMGGGKPAHRFERACTLLPGESNILMNLDDAGMFRRELVLHARLIDEDGCVRARTVDFAEIERNLLFPDARLELQQVGPDRILVRTDVFARSVELKASTPEGEAFGWDFEDNFFDLIPGEEHLVRILGPHRKGTVEARGFFCSSTASLTLA